MHKSFKALAALAVAGSVSAQGLSAQCSSAAQAILSNPNVTECLQIEALSMSFTGLSPTDSLAPPIAMYQRSLCAAPLCDNSTITAVVNDLLTGCAADLGTDSTINQFIASLAPSVLADVKTLLCLADNTAQSAVQNTNNTGAVPDCSANSQFCDIELIENLQETAGMNISYGLLGEFLSGNLTLADIGTLIGQLPANRTCNDCHRAAYQVVNDTLSSNLGLSLDIVEINGAPFPQAFDSLCGADFVETPYSTANVSVACSNSTAPAATRLRRRARWV